MGNLTGRARMNADLRLRSSLSPRALLLSTGEMLPDAGEALTARMMPVEYRREDVDLPQLSRAQEEAWRYRHAVAAYLDWLAPQYPDLQTTLPHRRDENRAGLHSIGGHARTPGIIANLQTAVDLFTEFAYEVDAMTAAQVQDLREEAEGAFALIGEQQVSRLTDTDPIRQFISVLDTLLSQGKVDFHERGVDKEPTWGRDLIGWYDACADGFIYLDMAAAWNRVARWFHDEGSTLGLTQAAMTRALVEQGYALVMPGPTGHGRHLTHRITMNGRSHRVLKLHMDPLRLPFAEQFLHQPPTGGAA